jgi:hypothetical protein
MLTAAECEVYAKEFGSLARQPDISEDRAAVFKNVARTFKGLSGQLDRLAAMQRNETNPALARRSSSTTKSKH